LLFFHFLLFLLTHQFSKYSFLFLKMESINNLYKKQFDEFKLTKVIVGDRSLNVVDEQKKHNDNNVESNNDNNTIIQPRTDGCIECTICNVTCENLDLFKEHAKNSLHLLNRLLIDSGLDPL